MGSFPFAMRSIISSRCLLLHTTLCVSARVPSGFLPMFPINLIWAILCICWSVTPRIPCVYLVHFQFRSPLHSPCMGFAIFCYHVHSLLPSTCTFPNGFFLFFSRALLRASPCISSLVFPMHSPIIPSHFATNFPCIPLYEVSPLGFLLVSPSITCGFLIR